MNDRVFDPLIPITNLYRDPNGVLRIRMPQNANIAADTVGRFAYGKKAHHPALIHENLDGTTEEYSFFELNHQAGQLAAKLRSLGVGPKEPVAVHTGQSPQTALAHLAIYKLGAIVMTLSHLYGPDSVAHCLNDCKARFVITQSNFWAPIRKHRDRLPHLECCIVHGDTVSGEISFDDCFSECEDSFEAVVTETEDPAILMYTSGSTGMPKGLLHSHRIIHAYIPTLTLVFNLELTYPDAVFWSPADWAWVGGLLDLVLPAWQHGQTVISTQHRFSAEWAFKFMERHQVTHSFMTPTALKRLAEIRNPRNTWQLAMRVVCTGGESLPGEVMRWTKEEFGIVCNEFYGLTEFNHMAGCCAALYETIPGSMGRVFPGRRVALIDELGNELPDDMAGEVASCVHDDPSLFLGYWGRLGVPEHMQLGDWLQSGDLAVRDSKGYFWYQGRNDDLIKSAGYRIGPNEVEDTLINHSSVAEAAVVAKPDVDRGSVVMAYVRLMQGSSATEEKKKELQEFVKSNLAVYKYPRVIEFVDSLPMTNSGKIRRNVLRRRAAQDDD